MEPTARREFAHHYSPGKALFQIVVKLKNEPNSLGQVVNMLGSRVNLIGTTTYTVGNDAAILSAFVEALQPDETAEKLRALVMSSDTALDTEVSEGRQGILVDAFHEGLEMDGDDAMLFRRRALVGMFDQVQSILGSGGELLLYEEGFAVGKADAEAFAKTMGPESARRNIGYLRLVLRARGAGTVEFSEMTEEQSVRIGVKDCFECSEPRGAKTGCHFFRGLLAGFRKGMFGEDLEVSELRCRLRGDSWCEFLMTAERARGAVA